MSKREILVGVVDQTIDVFVQDSSSTVGAGLAALVYNSASLTCYYRKGATGASAQLVLATQTVGGAHSDGGFVQIDATNMKGVYRLDLSDTMVAAAGMLTVVLRGAANMAPCVLEIEVVAVNKFDGVRQGLTALPNAVAGAASGLPLKAAAGDFLNVANIPQVAPDGVGGLPTTTKITDARLGSLTDWLNGGRLDLLLDAIPTTPMRGTDNAAPAATALSNAVWTDAKAGYIPAGLMPTQAEVLAIQNNTRVRVIVPPVVERPDAGSTTYRLWTYLYDTAGNMEAPESLPTITAQNNTGTDRSAGLSAVTNPSTGVYYADYTVASGHAIEGLLFQWSVVEGGVTRTHGAQALVVDTTAVDFTAADRTKLETLATDYTTARAGYLDNLSAGAAALEATLTAIKGATFAGATDSLEAIRDRGDATAAALAAVQADLPGRITKNVALANFTFLMVLTSDHVTGGTGLTVTAERSIDGAAFAACANAVVEIATGLYKINLAATDLNGDVICLKFTAATADARILTIVTQST